jgi:hypothetical protein
MELFVVFKDLRQFCRYQSDLHDNWVYGDTTFVVIRPACIHDTEDIEWAVEEIHEKWAADEVLGFFRELSIACQFADCYCSIDYAWFKNDKAVPYYTGDI